MVAENKKIRVGIVGLGGIAQIAHIPILKKLPDVEIVAVCDIEEAKVQWIGERYKIPKVYIYSEEMIEKENLDAVHICTPNHMHMPDAVDALKHGMHVLVERPIAVTVERAQKIVDAARQNKRILMVGMNHRFRPDAMILKKFVEGKELGDIFYAKAGWLRKRTNWADQSWQGDVKLSGGGVFMDLGIHMLDLSLWLMGNPKPVTVSAAVYHHISKKDAEDSVVTFIRCENQATLTVEVSWSLLMEKDFLYTNLFGTHGGALLNPLRIHKELHGNLVNVTPAGMISSDNLYKKSYEFEIQHFIECIRHDRPVLSSGEEALQRLQLVEAIYKSAESGKEVKV
jgi:predicted dehydrogenase